MLNNNEIEEPPNKKRFLSLNNGELDSLLDSAQSQSTKYNTAYAVSVFKGKTTDLYIPLKNKKSKILYL